MVDLDHRVLNRRKGIDDQKRANRIHLETQTRRMVTMVLPKFFSYGCQDFSDRCAGSAYSFHEIARVLTDLAGKPVHYKSISTEKFREQLVNAQMPALEVRLMIKLAEAIRSNEAACTKSGLEKMLGHRPTDLKTFLKETYFTNVPADV